MKFLTMDSIESTANDVQGLESRIRITVALDSLPRRTVIWLRIPACQCLSQKLRIG